MKVATTLFNDPCWMPLPDRRIGNREPPAGRWPYRDRAANVGDYLRTIVARLEDRSRPSRIHSRFIPVTSNPLLHSSDPVWSRSEDEDLQRQARFDELDERRARARRAVRRLMYRGR
jgi:hypothetical protein